MINISKVRPNHNPRITGEDLRMVLKYDMDTGYFILRKGFRMGGAKSPKPGDRIGKEDEMGMRHIRLYARIYPEHTLAWLYMYDKYPHNGLEHLNRDRGDNRAVNLLEIRSDHLDYDKGMTKSTFKGVFYNARDKKWIAQIGINGITKYLGRFDKMEDAEGARKGAESVTTKQ